MSVRKTGCVLSGTGAQPLHRKGRSREEDILLTAPPDNIP